MPAVSFTEDFARSEQSGDACLPELPVRKMTGPVHSSLQAVGRGE